MSGRVGVVAAACLSLGLASSSEFAPALKFDAASTEKSFEYSLGRDLVVQVRRSVDAREHPMGWDLSVIDRRLKESPNFLYECLCGHGPRAHDLYAWHFRDPQPFDGPGSPTDRLLRVYGYPYDLRVRFVDVHVTGTGTDVKFESGRIEIEWRRLAESHPRQRRIR